MSPLPGAAAGRHRDPLAAAQVGAGHRVTSLHNLFRRARGHDVPARLACARSHVHDPVRRAHRRLVVLHDQHRVAEVAQPLQGPDQPLVIQRMQPNRRLVAHIQHAHQRRADLGGQTDPLRFAAAQRRGRAVQGQVVEAHVHEERQAFANFLENLHRDRPLARRQRRIIALQAARPGRGGRDGHSRHFDDAAPVDLDREDFRLQPRPGAGRAGHRHHVPLDLGPRPIRVGVAVPPCEVGHHALVVRLILPRAPPVVGPIDHDWLRVAVEHRLNQLL